MQIDIPKLIQRLENSSGRKSFNETAVNFERKLKAEDETTIPVEESFPENWKDKYGKTHFYHSDKQMILVQSREIWDQRLHTLRKK